LNSLLTPDQVVSIHAPARDATSGRTIALFQLSVSIHAPARDATQMGAALGIPVEVSIHAPARDATVHMLLTFLIGSVSIHAPARDATPKQPTIIDAVVRFNPRTREGCDYNNS